MRIVIENSGYALTNMGDLSMLQVAVERLQDRWPNARIEVFTRNPKRLQEVCPGTYPIDLPGKFSLPWLTFIPSATLNRLLRASPIRKNISEIEWILHQKLPYSTVVGFFNSLTKKNRNNHSSSSQLSAVYAADLVVASGGGYLTDSFPSKAAHTLGILNLSTWLNKTTVLLGHGVGPLENPALSWKAQTVLPRVTFLSLREGRTSLSLLESFGVANHKLVVTGDDAIELAHKVRPEILGNGIGVNLRVARYSGVPVESIAQVRSALQEVASRKEASLVPVPIANQPGENDPEAIKELLVGYDDSSDGGKRLDTPIKVAKQVSLCRVVVTGSYHAGVFALSQGISVVCLARSQYYQDKFLGLAAQFGTGCEIVYLCDQNLRETLSAAIEMAWVSAEDSRPLLLEAAKRQIEQSQAAYHKVYGLIEAQK